MLAARGLKVSSLLESSASPKGRSGATKAAQPKGAEKSQARRRLLAFRHAHHPKRKDRLPFLEALHDLISSGLSAGEGVRLLSVRLKEPTMRSLCQGLWEHISEGAPLSRAMAAYPEVFDSSTCNLVAAGEATGSLNDTLDKLISHLTEQRELRRELMTAMAYPAFMMLMSCGVILFFLFYLLPRMQSLLTSLGGRLPVSTQLLIGMSNFVLHYGLWVGVGAVFLGVTFWRWRESKPGRAATDAWLLHLPFTAELSSSQTVLSISQTLSVLLENGITTAEALRMTERQISNTVHREAFSEAISRVMEGESLSNALGRTRCFPDLVLDRLAVGENTGNIVPALKDIAGKYRKSLSRQMQSATRVLTSTLMLFVFVFVGFLAFSIVSAVFQLSASFKM